MKQLRVLAVGCVAVLAGCKDDGGSGHLPDAPLLVVDAAGAEVSVAVTLGGQPANGQAVYFQNADSTLVRETRTDSDGKASAMMAAGGFVTVIEPELGAVLSYHLSTFAGVKPGDQLRLDLSPPFVEGTAVAFDLSVPNEQAGFTYTLFSSCGQALVGRGNGSVRRGARATGPGLAVTASITLNGCNGTADMLVLGVDSEDQLRSWLYKPNVAVANGVPVALTDEYEAPVDTAFSYTNMASISLGITIDRELLSARGRLYSTSSDLGPLEAISDGMTAALTVPLPGASVSMVTLGTDEPDGGVGQQHFVSWGDATASYTADYAGLALRGYDSSPVIDVASHAVVWTDAAGVTPDYVLTSYFASRDDVNDQSQWAWRLVGPYVAGQPKLVFPVLPTTVFDFAPKANDTSEMTRLTSVKSPGGYDAVRAGIFNDGVPTSIGVSGTLVYEDLRSSNTRRAPRPRISTTRAASLRTR